MANKRSGTAAPAKAAKPAKATVTIEIARLLSPAPRVVENIANTFGLSVPDFDGIRESHESALRKMWHSFDDALNERATMMHFQRITGSLVSSAVGAGRFYSEKVSAARDLTSSLANDHRDEDRDAPVGFDSKAQRAREFAADMAMQAYALLAAAEGAVTAYQEITGEEWKAYQAPTQSPATVERRSAAAEVNAFTA